MYSEKLFRGTKKRFGGEINAFFGFNLTQIDLGNDDTWKMFVFVWNNCEICTCVRFIV